MLTPSFLYPHELCLRHGRGSLSSSTDCGHHNKGQNHHLCFISALFAYLFRSQSWVSSLTMLSLMQFPLLSKDGRRLSPSLPIPTSSRFTHLAKNASNQFVEHHSMPTKSLRLRSKPDNQMALLFLSITQRSLPQREIQVRWAKKGNI